MTKRVALYTRVSTLDGQQTTENQLQDLNLAAERSDASQISKAIR